MVIFHSYVKLPEGTTKQVKNQTVGWKTREKPIDPFFFEYEGWLWVFQISGNHFRSHLGVNHPILGHPRPPVEIQYYENPCKPGVGG